MPKGQPLTRYQQKIVNRYYEHLDSIAITKLAEAVSELYLCDSDKKAARLWASVEKALDKTAASDAKVKRILTDKNVADLAKLVGELSGSK